MFNGIHHVAIIASDYDRSKVFYTQTLGLTIIREVYREERESYKLDLAVGDTQIELFSFPEPPARANGPEAAGLRHLCFEVDDVRDTKRQLERKGIEVEEVRTDPYTDRSFTFFKDPDGLPLEIYERS